MPIGTSDGEYHEDQLSYAIADHSTPKQRSDAAEMQTNETSGDFQSRFGGAEQRPLVYIERPPQAPTEPAGALESPGSTQTPDNIPLTRNVVDKLTGMDGGERYQTWPERMVRGALDAAALPGDVMSGKQPMWQTDPDTGETNISTQAIERATDLAGLMVTGPAPVAAKMADGTLGSFMGVKSATIDKTALYKAQNLEMDGIHPDDIWNQTGTFRGADGRWRQEIDDSQAKLKPEAFTNNTIENDPRTGGETNQTISLKKPPERPLNFGDHQTFLDYLFSKREATPSTLDKVMDHPELFKAYPELRGITVHPMPSYTNSIGMLRGRDLYLKNDLDPEFARGVILHEVQHAIQDTEGFARGGNAGEFLPPELSAAEKQFEIIKAEIEPQVKKALKTDDKGFESIKRVVNAVQEGWAGEDAKLAANQLKEKDPLSYKRLSNIVESERLLNNAHQEAFTKYERLMGEVEARNVQARRSFGDYRRKNYSPTVSEDTPRFLQTNR